MDGGSIYLTGTVPFSLKRLYSTVRFSLLNLALSPSSPVRAISVEDHARFLSWKELGSATAIGHGYGDRKSFLGLWISSGEVEKRGGCFCGLKSGVYWIFSAVGGKSGLGGIWGRYCTCAKEKMIKIGLDLRYYII